MNIIIMAHGNQNRWFENLWEPERLDETITEYSVRMRRIRKKQLSISAKHLLPIRNQPLLKRTIDLFAPYGDITVFAWKEYEKHIDYPCSTIHPVKSLLDGILQTRGSWGDKTVFLLGDVLFSRQAVSDIVKINELRFFGRPGPNRVSGKAGKELFGFTMMREDWDQVIEYCELVIVKQKKLKCLSNLWALYRLCCGNECHQDIIDLKLLEVIDDYTDDIDSPQAYNQFWDSMIGAELDDN